MNIKKISEVSRKEQEEFINSFDQLLLDMDGVIWMIYVPIPDAQDCIDNFKKIGKTVQFVTNSAFNSRDITHERLIKNKFNVELEDIANPYLAVIQHLKKINFQKKIYAITSQFYKNQLKSEGFEIVEDPPQLIEENVFALFQNIQDDEEVGAVIYDFDINITYIKLQKALTYLKRPDCLFITGAADKSLPVGQAGPLLGNFYNYQGLIEISGRTPLQLAKPSKQFSEFIKEKFQIQNPERVLFIGDMINEDMGFATVSGFKKLLVLSGNTKIDSIKNWKHPEEYKPNYYIENLTELNKIIRTIHKL